MRFKVLLAVLQRNLVSYFSNPTGYVFICVFVALSSAAAFWSPEFFSNNLANLDQLNVYFPAIMVFFVPAITMSLWAEERKQSTDELLLTLPTTDLDIVLGKYLAAVAIYAISLVFSLISNYLVLRSLGSPDTGLFISTYVGYLLVGMAMLSVGMVASFLTANITVAFVLGALFNAPLVLLQYVNTMLPRAEWALSIKTWSIRQNLDELGRGVLSISAVAYFGMIIAMMLYLSVILIGRRHWLGGKDGHSMLQHYAARFAALMIVSVGVALFFRHHNSPRFDLTDAGINSLSEDTEKMLAELEPPHTIEIDAYVSPQVPEAYVQKRQDVLSMLKEIENEGGSKVVVRIFDTTPASELATRIEEQHGIEKRTVSSRARGTNDEHEIYLGAVIRCGLSKVVVPFFELGVPAEYELIRSIATASESKKKKLGIVRTAADLMGGARGGPEAIVDELKKQYEVIDVDPDKKIIDLTDPDQHEYAALLVVQPSTMTAPQLSNLTDAIKAGVPTAIFQDPLAAQWPQRLSMPSRGGIENLWALLGVQMSSEEAVWQDFNPYPKLRGANRFLDFSVFASEVAPGARNSFNPDPVTAGLNELLFLYPGGITYTQSSNLDFVTLVRTGNRTGTVSSFGLLHTRGDLTEAGLLRATGTYYTLAARIRGKVNVDPLATSPKSRKLAYERGKVNVILVADIDVLSSTFLDLRANPNEEYRLRFQNVPFVLNVIDSLTGDNRFLNVRKREQTFRTLESIDRARSEIRKKRADTIAEHKRKYEDGTANTQKELNNAITALEQELEQMKKKGDVDPKKIQAAEDRLNIKRAIELRKKAVSDAALERERDQKIDDLNDEVRREERAIQFRYKLLAVALPPIPPLLFAIFFLYRRKLQEQEGVEQGRLR